MDKILLYAGTAEARAIAEYLRGNDIQVYAAFASDYGKEMIPESNNIKVLPEVMDASELKYFIRKNQISRVIDATYPFAGDMSEQIKKACREMHTVCQRIIGMQEKKEPDIICMGSVQEVIDYLKGQKGKVLIGSGSKDLAAYKQLDDYKERCYARVDSTKESMAEGARLGFEGAHLIALQGPFTELMNEAVLRQVEADYFVVKDAGSGAGLEEKTAAARKTGARMIVISSKPKQEGITVEKACEDLRKLYEVQHSRKVYFVGMGTGSQDYLTGRAREILDQSDIVIGAPRILSYVKTHNISCFEASQPKEMCDYLRAHPEYSRIAIALSGDVSFYSGAKRIKKALGEYETEMIPGISAVSYLASVLHTDIEDAVVLSAHGKNLNVIGALKNSGRVFILMDSGHAVNLLCEELIGFGYDRVRMSVGNRLSCGDEMIMTGYPKDCMEREYDDHAVVYLEEKKWSEPIVTYGFSDEEFERSDYTLTPSEARSIVISKLRLQKDAIVYDISAGCGAFSVEIAGQVLTGLVYAVENNEKGIELIKSNQVRFAASNVVPVSGNVPEVFSGLPMPTHALIEDTEWEIDKVLDALFKKNRRIRIVVSAMSLNTVSECMAYLKKHDMEDKSDVTCITAAVSVGSGSKRKMEGKDPAYIIAFGGKAC